MFSKSKFDIGRTDLIEYKVTMKSEDPIHIRQFRIPLEHRQTIYDWVDELLKKGAIEVYRTRDEYDTKNRQHVLLIRDLFID